MYDNLFNLINIPILKVDISNDNILLLNYNEYYKKSFNIETNLENNNVIDLVKNEEFKWMKAYLKFFYSNNECQKMRFAEKIYEINKIDEGKSIFFIIHRDKTLEINLKDRLDRTQKIGKIGDWENNTQLNNQKWSDGMYTLLGEQRKNFDEDYDFFMNHVHPDDYDRVKFVNEKSIEEKKEYSIEFRIIDRKQNVKWMFTRGKFLFDYKGNVKKVYGVMQDISENKRLEMLLLEEIDKSKAISEYKSKFLANMSHEIRTPLGSILGMSKLLINNNLDMLSVNYVNNILSSGNLLLDLVNDILDLSKIESGKIELDNHAFDFIFLMQSIKNVFQGKLINTNIDFTITIDESIPRYLYGDSHKIRQILINLIGNSIKFTEKGFVKLNILLGTNIAGKIDLLFEVTDSGIGIESDKLDLIFDDYSQNNSSVSRRFGGTGLGLTISKHLIGLMNGSVKVSSKLGFGSKFSFNVILELSSRKEVEFEEDFFEPLFLKESIPVLVAEDDSVNQIYFKTFLKQTYNFDVDIVDDGIKALDLIKKKKYEIVFLDSNMPNLDGRETAKRIRNLDSNNRELCLVALTAEAFKDDEEKFLKAGFNYYVSKPINEELFSKVMKTILKDNIKFPIREDSFRSKDEFLEDEPTDYKYLSMENILEKSELLGSNYFIIIMEYAIEEYNEKYASILDELAQKDIDQIYYQLHSVQGTLLYFSTSKLTNLIKCIEVCIKNKEYDNIYEFLNEFLTIFPVFIEELTDFYNHKKLAK